MGTRLHRLTRRSGRRHALQRRYGHARRQRGPSDAWRHTSEGNIKYLAARSEAQSKANELGFDHMVEANDVFKQFSVSMLPGKKYRSGHELRGEVVMCENLNKCQPGHGPMA